MNFLAILFLFCFSFDNAIARKKIFDFGKLTNFLKSKHQLWSQRKLTNDEMNYYMHRVGAMVDVADLKRHSQPLHQSRLQFSHGEVDLPDRFDARTDPRWEKCSDIISTIPDQSRCNNCWAISTASVMSDRACIATGGDVQVHISAYDLTRCCEKCQASKGDGCKYGIAAYAFNHFSDVGVVTGGIHNSNKGCIPYPFPPTKQAISHSSGACEAKCTDGETDYEGERHFGKGTYYNPVGEEAMKKEIYLNGPIAVSIEFHKELTTFHNDAAHAARKGIYHITNPDFNATHGSPMYHAVRILGWDYDTIDGTDVPYWIVANSWGPNWGDGGTFKHIRGLKQGKIEEYAIAGMYDVDRAPKKSKK